MYERSVPYDLNAERAVLGALLLDRDAIIVVAPLLKAETFYLEKHAWIYAAALTCYNRRVPPDLATVADVLRRQEQLEPVGGLSFLGELLDEVPTAVHAEYYAQIVARTATQRQLIIAGGEISALGYDQQAELPTTLDSAEQILFAVSQQYSGADFQPIDQIAQTYFEQLQRDEDEVVATGLELLDRQLNGGMRPGNLVLLAARPGLGKTGLALSIAHHVALRERRPVAVVSLEMANNELMDRLLGIHTGVDTQAVRQRLRKGDVRLVDAMGALAGLPLAIDDTAGQSVLDVRSKARRWAARREGLSLLIIDYLQLLLTDTPTQSRVDEVSRVSRQLKLLAKELRCPVLALSQLSRAVENRASKVPQLSDLRDSGALEQDADVVCFIHREEAYDPETAQKGMAELHVAKNRHGATGIVPLRFHGPTTRFVSDLMI